MSALRDRRGFSMVELIMGIVVSTIVLGAAYTLLQNNQRFYRAQSQIVDVQQNIRAVAELLPAELRELSSTGGDILAMDSATLTVRAPRGLGIVCATPDAVNGRIVLKNSQWWGYRTPDATRDGLYVFGDLDSTIASDDTWIHADISSSLSVNCADGSAGSQLQLTNVVGGAAALAGVYVGAPVRTHETVTYSLWFDGSADWWLGVSQLVSGSWTATSPVAGPLRANNGVKFEYFDANGNATTVITNVTWITASVVGESNQPIFVQGRPTGTYTDSLTVRAALRGN